MIRIDYPKPDFRIKKEKGVAMIFDTFRKRWLVLTPEEWVRQNFLQYLVQEKKFPSSLIALEKRIQLVELTKRFDILIYDNNHRPFMMIECKAPEIKLDQSVLEQVLRYNISTPVDFLVITNGEMTFAWKKETSLVALDEIPEFGTV